MTARLLSLAALALAACSGRSPPPPRPAPSASPSPDAIPLALQGRYGLTPDACAAGPDATATQVRGLLTIGGAAIAFGVSQQSVDSVAIRADRVVFDTSVTAEGGATESRRYTFRQSPDHATLARVELNRPDQVYTRCPNRPS